MNPVVTDADDKTRRSRRGPGFVAPLLRASVARGALGVLVLRVLQVGLEFFCGLILARLLGASSFGSYAFALSWVGLLGIPAAFGFDRLLIREIAKAHVRQEWPILAGLLRRSGQIVGITATAVALTAAVGVHVLASQPETEMTIAVQLGMFIVPLVAFARIRQAALQGLGRTVWAQVPETLIQPALLIILVGGLFLVPDIPRTGPVAVALHLAAAGMACGWGVLLLRRSRPPDTKAVAPEYRTRDWLVAAAPFLWMLGMNVVVTYADVIMVGLLLGPESAGTYRVASQMAAFVAFPLTAVNLAFAPTIARFHVQNERAELQRAATTAAQAILATSLPVALTLIVFGRPILALFGAEFVEGDAALTILASAYLLNAAMGTSGYLLIMTKHERAAATVFSTSALINVIGNLLLIPAWGINGAATATALSLTILCVAFAVLTRRKLGIHPTALLSPRKS